jgi:hypothetical protein
LPAIAARLHSKGSGVANSLSARPEFDAREEARVKRKQEELAPFLAQAMTRKERMAPLADEQIPSFVALGRQVANGPQLTPEQEAARRRMLAAAQIPLKDSEKASAAE